MCIRDSAVNVIWFVPCPDVIVPFAMVHVKLLPATAGTLATRPVPPAGTAAGTEMTGAAGAVTVVLALAALLPPTGSDGLDAATEALFVAIAPLGVAQTTLPVSVMVADAPDASDANVTVGTALVPPLAPPPVGAHGENAIDEGSASVTTAFVAGEGPLFVTVSVYVTDAPMAARAVEQARSRGSR